MSKPQTPFIGAGHLFSATKRGQDLSEVHDCEKCHGKLVMILIDKLGVTRCGYCHAIVNYREFFERRKEEPRIRKMLAQIKKTEERKEGSRAKRKKYFKKH